MKEEQPKCFVMMPISDADGYEPGHFARVYEHLIKPACEAAGFVAIRADDVKSTNYIVLDILTQIVSSSMVVCDLSARNANVLYELGVRHAFDLPVVLIKDRRTDRIFDIQGMRTADYDETLRVDTVQRDIKNLTSALVATRQSKGSDVNSLVKLLGISRAQIPDRKEVSEDTAVILASIKDLAERITEIEHAPKIPTGPNVTVRVSPKTGDPIILPNGENVAVGDPIYDGSGNELGTLIGALIGSVLLKTPDGKYLSLDSGKPLYHVMSGIPF